YIGSSKGKLGPVTDKIDEWYKIRSQMERECMSTLVSLLTSEVRDMFKPVYRVINKFALVKIRNQLAKRLKKKQKGILSPVCSCFVKVWKLHCRHEPAKCVEEHVQVKLDFVHPKWHIYYMNKDEFFIDYEHLRNQVYEIFLNSKTYQEKQDIFDSMEKLIKELVPNDISNVKAPTLPIKVERKEVEKSSKYLSLIEQINPSIERNWYTAAINKFWEVKIMMRDFLLTMDEGKDECTSFYKKHLNVFVEF
ncbi:hypothetical protein EDC96DRAFT_528647, partial [Choanephora cucurbitarum]